MNTIAHSDQIRKHIRVRIERITTNVRIRLIFC